MRHKNDMQKGFQHKTNQDGYLEVVQFYTKNKVLVRFIETGAHTYAGAQNIREGRVKDRNRKTVHGVGCIGFGEYRSSNNGVRDAAYVVWWGLMDRCYSPDAATRYPTYVGCTVADEWHNFQVFARWYYENKPDGVFDLDKDIKSGSKRGLVYSPSTCVFVSPKENTQHSQSKPFSLIDPTGCLHQGVGLVDFCRENGLDPSAISRVLRGKAKQHKQWRKGK